MPARSLTPLAARALAGAALSLALGLLAAPARSATTVSGTVLDRQSHQPVAGALVAAEGTRSKVRTDDAGHFTLSAEHAITSLVITSLGYARSVVAVTDPTATLAVELVPEPLPQVPVEVTGRAVRKDDLRRSQATGSLTRQDLDRGNGLELEGALNTVPGVLMQSRTAWGGAHIQIRGYYPNFSQNSNGLGAQQFWNDIPITDATGQTILDDVDFAALGRVEVIKGPGSSLYGGAIGGTVNFYTLAPVPGVARLEQQGTGGSDGLFRTSTSFTSDGEHSSLLLNYGHQTYDSFRPDSESGKDYARFQAGFRVGPRQSLSTTFAYAKSFERLAGEIDSTDFYARRAIDNPIYRANDSQIAIESGRMGFTHEVSFND